MIVDETMIRSSQPVEPARTRWWCRRLALVYALLMLYGSLVPLDFHALPPGELIRQFWAMVTAPEALKSRSDFLANVLLGGPLGFLVLGTVAPGWRRGALLVVPVVLCCTLYGAGIECLQLMFPPRDCSRNDILAQGLGAAVGAAGWLILGQQLSARVSGVFGQSANMAGAGNPRALLVLYILVILILEAAPFDFTLSPVELVHKWREGWIHPVPFAAFGNPERHMGMKTLTVFLLFLPAGLLLGGYGRGHGGSGWRILALGILLAGAVEMMQLFVLHRHFEATDVFIGAAAVVLGWGCRGLWRPPPSKRRLPWRSLLLAAWICVFLAMEWSPFDFTPAVASERWMATTLIPFVDYQQQQYLAAFDGIVQKVLLFIPCGLLLSCLAARWRGVWFAVAMGAAVAAVGESGQLLLPSRTPSVSDVLLAAVGSGVGHLLARHLGAAQSEDAVSTTEVPGVPPSRAPADCPDAGRT